MAHYKEKKNQKKLSLKRPDGRPTRQRLLNNCFNDAQGIKKDMVKAKKMMCE